VRNRQALALGLVLADIAHLGGHRVRGVVPLVGELPQPVNQSLISARALCVLDQIVPGGREVGPGYRAG
jgi:hypothetical protein